MCFHLEILRSRVSEAFWDSSIGFGPESSSRTGFGPPDYIAIYAKFNRRKAPFTRRFVNAIEFCGTIARLNRIFKLRWFREELFFLSWTNDRKLIDLLHFDKTSLLERSRVQCNWPAVVNSSERLQKVECWKLILSNLFPSSFQTYKAKEREKESERSFFSAAKRAQVGLCSDAELAH